MKFREGMRRSALFLGVLGSFSAGVVAYIRLQDALTRTKAHDTFETLAHSDVVVESQNFQRNKIGFRSLDTVQVFEVSPNYWTVDPASGLAFQRKSEVSKKGIRFIEWKNQEYDISSIGTADGSEFFPTPAPPASDYIVIAALPLIGFILPWGIVRAAAWVGSGFFKTHQ